MKQLLILLGILLLNTFTLNAGGLSHLDSLANGYDVNVKDVKNLDSKPIMNQIYEDVKEALVGLSGALKVGSEHVYKVLIKQQIVNSVIFLFLGILSTYLIINFMKNYKSDEQWILKNTNSNDPPPTFLGVIRGLQMVLAIILLMIFLFNIDVVMTGFINPEYGALTEIMKWIK